ncbi:MAG: redoxin domain-containing protein [Gammaproteobacteria bacterium]|nr:redoxin domain-containing protein [Gammaproteobacteria bacterium]
MQILKNLSIIVAFVFPFSVSATTLPDKLLNIPIHLISGENTSLIDFKSKKPVYLKFWATWCRSCIKEMPHFEHVQNEHGEDIQVIGINLGVNDDINTVKKVIEDFGLSMPMAIDKSGDLAQAFKMIGTPYHLLFDKNMNLIHRGHKANESLDNKLALVSKTNPVDLLDIGVLSNNELDLNLPLNDGKTHALFFTATWCDWYLKDSRPSVSKNCSMAQINVNELSKTYPDFAWHGIISRLWTGDKDLIAYKNKYQTVHGLTIDKNNQLFHHYSVKDLPTLILVKNNEVIVKITSFIDRDSLVKILAESK